LKFNAGIVRKTASVFENFCAEAAPRKAAKTPADAYRAQLEQIPGVSEHIARAIVGRFSTLRSLIDNYFDPRKSVGTPI